MTEPELNVPEQVFLQYKPHIYGYIHAKRVPESDRDDLFGEVMLKATRYAHAYDAAKASLSTWVYTVCRSVVANYYRKKRPESPLPETLPADFCVERRVELEHDLRALAHALERLPARDRQIIVLRFYKDMGYGEIARAMKLSEVNVRVICSRALKKLKSLMPAAPIE